MAVAMELPLAPPVESRFALTRMVVPLVRFRKNTFNSGPGRTERALPLPLVRRLLAVLAKSTKCPSGVRIGAKESPLPPAGGGWPGSRWESNRSGPAVATPKNVIIARDAKIGIFELWVFI